MGNAQRVFRGVSAFAWQHREDTGDEYAESVHEVPQELLGRLIGDFTVVGDQAGRELDVGLGSAHLRGVAEAQRAAQMLLGECGSDFPGEAPITADGLRANEFVPYGRLAQSMAFLRLPGMPRLYSGVTNSTASTEAMVSFSARPAGG